ncbi:MAG: hypothetical protein KIT40_04025 [Nitrospira sp.]|nr:hypothetical protein [Nitrospira sp.]
METATSFAPVRRWMPSRNPASGGGTWLPAMASLRPVVRQIAVGCLLLNMFFVLPVHASMESVAVADTHIEDGPLDVVSGITYRAGTRLRIPGTGWSFVVPDGWQSNRPDDAEMPFLIPEEGKELGMMFPLPEVTRDALREQLREPLSLLHGLSFIPAGSQVETEAWIAQSYEGEEMAGRALAVMGAGNTAVIYFLMGAPHNMSIFQSVLEQLGQSTRFGQSVSGRDAGL